MLLASLLMMAPQLDQGQLLELAPPVQAQLEVGALRPMAQRRPVAVREAVTFVNQRVPRLQISHSAFAPLANAMGAQQLHTSLQDRPRGKGALRISEHDIAFVVCMQRWWSGVSWPTR